LDRKVFDRFRSLVYEKSGIALSDQKEALVSARVSKQMRALGLADYGAYYNYVASDQTGQEIVRLIDAISTNVTSFYREPEHFTFLSETISKWADSGQRRFRLWSAAASTGEEPYTIAITLQECLGQGADVKLLATDISTRVLEKCRIGKYEDRKLQTVPGHLRERYFTRTKEGDGVFYTANNAIRNMISFKRLNLSTLPFPMRGPMDVVFCRNVMIYFDNTVRSRLLGEIHRLLRPGGYLLVGHAESLTGMMSSFKTVKPSVYIK
jgi:chemotaxis protein methyltransferase CheR